MKTAEFYWNSYLRTPTDGHTTCFATYRGLDSSLHKHVEAMVAAIRADALAEKSVATDADEERAKREYERLTTLHPEPESILDWDHASRGWKVAWRAYVKTLPPRPVRSPEERLFSTLQKLGHLRAYESWDHYSRGNPHSSLLLIAEATALGIKPQE